MDALDIVTFEKILKELTSNQNIEFHLIFIREIFDIFQDYKINKKSKNL